MPEQRNGLTVIRGSLPQATSRNGLDLAGRPYRYRGHPGWSPEEGVHRDPLVVAAAAARGGAASGAAITARRSQREARIAEFARLRGEGLSVAAAAARLGLSAKTGESYARELRKAGGGS